MDPKDSPLPKTFTVKHTCQGSPHEPVALPLTTEGVYRGSCPRCGIEMEVDRTGSFESTVSPSRR